MKGKEFDFVDCCIKLSEKDDFETELGNLCADKNATLEQVFNCVKNRLEKVEALCGEKGSGVSWYLKQLLPLKYIYKRTIGGKVVSTVWRMWFGKCFSVRTIESQEE